MSTMYFLIPQCKYTLHLTILCIYCNLDEDLKSFAPKFLVQKLIIRIVQLPTIQESGTSGVNPMYRLNK